MTNQKENTQKALSKEELESVFALYSVGKFNDAIDSINVLSQKYPNVPILFNILGACYKGQGELKLAIEMFKKCVLLKPDYAEVHNNLGLTFLQLNNLDDASVSFKNATNYMPNFFEAYYNHAIVLKKMGSLDDAIKSYEKVIEIKPNYAEAHNNLGTILMDLGKLDSAKKRYQEAIEIRPDFAEAYNNLGNLLKNLGKLQEAISEFQRAIDLNANFAEAHFNIGTSLIELGENSLAIESFKKALSVKPDYAEAQNNLGNAFKEHGQLNTSIECYKKAIRLNNNYAEAHNNLGLALMSLGRIDDALFHLKIALKINPDYIFANNNFGSLLSKLGKFSESISFYQKAISLDSNFFEAYSNLGNSLKYLKRHDESLAAYERSYEINPEAKYSLGNIAHSKLHLSKWNNLDKQIKTLKNKILNNERVIVPFPLLAIIDDPELHKNAAQIYIDDKYPVNLDLPKIGLYSRHKKIRIGYFSPDFRVHPVANLTAELYEIHDRSKFEVYAFSFGPDTGDEMNLRIKAGVDYFHDVRSMSHKEVASLSRSLELDIAIDLGGFTQDTRTEIFAMQAAPIQVNYLGYSSTMGADYMNYIIADKTLIPENKQKYYSEKIVYLPDSFMVNDTKNKISKRIFTRQEVGLPEKGFVFSCFNHHYKITPIVFESWMRILTKVDESVLWLSDGNTTGIDNLKKEARKNNIDESRLIIAPRLDLREDHLNRIKLADLFLDTLPYNAHATTSDALQVGLPVLTQIGESFASRVAASLINSVDMPELITESQKEYEELAIELATSPDKLNAIKDKLQVKLISSPLYNTPLYTKHLEAAYLVMYERYQERLEPDHIYV